MKAFVEGIEVEGSVHEIKELIESMRPEKANNMYDFTDQEAAKKMKASSGIVIKDLEVIKPSKCDKGCPRCAGI